MILKATRARLGGRRLGLLLALLPCLATPLHVAILAAQEGNVEILAGILAAEDARRFDEPLFRSALSQPDVSVRRSAAMALGRLRDPRGIPLLAPLLVDPDSLFQADVIFALGQLGDTGALTPLLGRARNPEPLSYPAALELIAAVARLGGPRAASFLAAVLEGSQLGEQTNAEYLRKRAALEAWRLGRLAPVDGLLGVAGSPKEDIRYAAIYSLGRVRARAAAPRMVDALTDRTAPDVRAVAARTLNRAYADSAGLNPETVADLLLRAVNDQDPAVQVNALRSLASFRLARVAAKVLPLLEATDLNVQVQAAQTLAELGGQDAVEELRRLATGAKGTRARRVEALRALARLDRAAFESTAGSWTGSSDWRDRAAAAAGWARIEPARLTTLLQDRDARVVAAALQAWSTRVEGAEPALLQASRGLLQHDDAAVRSIAADIVGRAADPSDIAALLSAYRKAARDSFPDAALSALGALASISAASPEARERVNREALAAIPRADNYLIRRWAEDNWPEAADLWGPAYPLRTGRSPEDYRELARQYLVGQGPERYPRVHLVIEQLGPIELELFGPEAPLTVANFLSLVDRRYFDGMRFHRVVPSFVVQAGDPRGDGWGGPGGAIRDEINRRRYDGYVLGMALAGPDTGGSQWFITLGPQPHLDGGYTVFGEVTDGIQVLRRITQGDVIRSIRR